MSDLIERQAVLDGLARIAKAKAKSIAQQVMFGRAIYFVEHLPSVGDAIYYDTDSTHYLGIKERTGQWCAWKPEDDVWRTTCSECGEETRTLWNYCPHCGAKMEV